MLSLQVIFHHLASIASEVKVDSDILESPRKHVMGKHHIPSILHDPYGIYNHSMAVMFEDFLRTEFEDLTIADLFKENSIYDWQDHQYIVSRIPYFLQNLNENDFVNKSREIADDLYRAWSEKDAVSYFDMVSRDLRLMEIIQDYIDPRKTSVIERKSEI